MQVNFLIAGTQKGGTTALAHFLSLHPQIYMAPCKEVHFFDYDQKYYSADRKTVNYDYYHGFFPDYTNQRAIGEATPIYMYFPWIAQRIYTYNPDMKLIILLRNPVERAYSHYQMEKARGWEWLPFHLAIQLEPLRLKLARDHNNEKSSLRVHSYLKRGFYVTQIQNLLRFFPRENLLILLSEELRQSHEQTLKHVYEFLQIETSINIPLSASILAGKYNSIAQKTKTFLQNYFAKEIEELEVLLNKDLSHWRA